MSLAPVPTRNRFQALEETNIVDSNGAAIFREKIVELKLLVKPNKSKKKRRGKRQFLPATFRDRRHQEIYIYTHSEITPLRA